MSRVVNYQNIVTEKMYSYDETNLLAIVISSEYNFIEASNTNARVLGFFVPSYDGIVCLESNAKTTNSTSSCAIYPVSLGDQWLDGALSNGLTLGSYCGISYFYLDSNVPATRFSKLIHNGTTSYTLKRCQVSVKKGMPMAVILGATNSGSTSVFCNSVKIYGKIIEV